MNCVDCGTEMIWQNDWDISEENEPPKIQTDHECPECGLYQSIIRTHKGE